MGEQGMQRLRSAHLLLSLLPVFSPFSIFFTFRRGGGRRKYRYKCDDDVATVVFVTDANRRRSRKWRHALVIQKMTDYYHTVIIAVFLNCGLSLSLAALTLFLNYYISFLLRQFDHGQDRASSSNGKGGPGAHFNFN
jgi:hypothetical protein